MAVGAGGAFCLCTREDAECRPGMESYSAQVAEESVTLAPF